MKANKCTDCVHCGWGLSVATQQCEHKVCLLKPKKFKNNTGEFYYAIQGWHHACDKFKKKEV